MSRSYEESLTKSKRSLSAWKAKRENAAVGVTTTPLTPGWIRVVNGKRELIANRAALIERMFQMANSGMGRQLIAKQFNREGIDTWGHGANQARKGKGWDGSYITWSKTLGQLLKKILWTPLKENRKLGAPGRAVASGQVLLLCETRRHE